MAEEKEIHPAFLSDEGKFKCLVFKKIMVEGAIMGGSPSLWALMYILDISKDKIGAIPNFLLKNYGEGDYLLVAHVFSNIIVRTDKSLQVPQEIVIVENKKPDEDSLQKQ